MKQPIILLPMDIKNRIQFIVDNCDKEVSGLGTVVFDKSINGYRVTSAILLDQEVGSAHTDIDDKAVAQALYDTRNEEGELAFWWHSHVNMETFWSDTDHATMEAIGKNGLCVAVVFNKKDSMRGAIVMNPQGMPSVKLDNVDIEIEYDYAFNPEELLAEIKEKVREKTYAPLNQQTRNVNSILNDTSYSKHYWGDENIPAFSEKEIHDTWSKMSKQERSRWVSYQDYKDEMLWGEDPRYYNTI